MQPVLIRFSGRASGRQTLYSWSAFMLAEKPARRPWVGSVHHGLRVALTGLAFGGFFLGAALLGWFVLRLAHLGPGTLSERQRRCQRWVRATWVCFHHYLGWVGLVDLARVSPPFSVRAPAIVIANHPTLFDITALTVVVGPACVVAKRSLFANPLVGPLLRACGHIPVGAPGDGTDLAVDQAEARLRAGHVVILFPEGTRSPVGGLGRFRLGAFELARRTGVPIQPMRITALPPALWKGVPWYSIPRRTVDFRIEPLAPVFVPPSATMAELHDITARTKAALADPMAAAA
jgi:1-acyl-sn-glycerol-3-phosphate acyltransferase